MCKKAIARGNLMCGWHWRCVPAELKEQVWLHLRRWNEGEGTLGELRDAQDKAIESVTGKESNGTR